MTGLPLCHARFAATRTVGNAKKVTFFGGSGPGANLQMQKMQLGFSKLHLRCAVMHFFLYRAILYQGHDESLGFIDRRKGMDMRNALYQVALLIAALGLSGSMFATTLA